MFWAILMVAVRGPEALRRFGQKLTPGVEFPDVLWDMMTTGAKGFRPGVPMPRRVSDQHLHELTIPTLLYMAGRSEVYDAGKAAARARAHMPNAEIVVVEYAQHGLPFTHPERTWGDVLDFVRRHEVRTQAAP
jgi:pimeloyl-ACP methyl ester carboxylesterase